MIRCHACEDSSEFYFVFLLAHIIARFVYMFVVYMLRDYMLIGDVRGYIGAHNKGLFMGCFLPLVCWVTTTNVREKHTECRETKNVIRNTKKQRHPGKTSTLGRP